MEHKITFRLSDDEYYILELVSHWHKNNKSKAMREIIQYYKNMAILTIPTKKFIEVFKNPTIKEEK